jgi:hypothetical protein
MRTDHELATLALQGLVSCHTSLSVLTKHVDAHTAHTIQKIQHGLLFDPALNFVKLGQELDIDFLTVLTRIFPSMRR